MLGDGGGIGEHAISQHERPERGNEGKQRVMRDPGGDERDIVPASRRPGRLDV